MSDRNQHLFLLVLLLLVGAAIAAFGTMKPSPQAMEIVQIFRDLPEDWPNPIIGTEEQDFIEIGRGWPEPVGDVILLPEKDLCTPNTLGVYVMEKMAIRKISELDRGADKDAVCKAYNESVARSDAKSTGPFRTWKPKP